MKVQKAAKRYVVITEPVEVREGDKLARLEPADGFSVSFTADFGHPLITNQGFAVAVSDRTFEREVARARTFCFRKDIELMQSMGLAKGGSLENAIVVDEYSILNPEGLRCPDEFARHKVLDAIGDLALLGKPLLGALTAVKSGHALNQALVKRVLADPTCHRIVQVSAGERGGARPPAGPGRRRVPPAGLAALSLPRGSRAPPWVRSSRAARARFGRRLPRWTSSRSRSSAPPADALGPTGEPRLGRLPGLARPRRPLAAGARRPGGLAAPRRPLQALAARAAGAPRPPGLRSRSSTAARWRAARPGSPSGPAARCSSTAPRRASPASPRGSVSAPAPAPAPPSPRPAWRSGWSGAPIASGSPPTWAARSRSTSCSTRAARPSPSRWWPACPTGACAPPR